MPWMVFADGLSSEDHFPVLWEDRKDRGGDINTLSMEMVLYALTHTTGNAITQTHAQIA